MAQVIKNMGQFAKVLELKVVATLELVAEDVKKEIFRRYEEGLGGMMLGQMVRRAREKQN